MPNLNAGADAIEVVIDYGEVAVPSAVQVVAPTISVFVDNRDVAAPSSMVRMDRAGHIAFIATLIAPAAVSDNVRIGVSAVPGVTAFLSNVFALKTTPVSTSIQECPASACELAGAVGTVHAVVRIPGEVPQSITVRNVVNGIATDAGSQTTTTELGENETSKVVEMLVPTAPEGSEWRLEVQLGTARFPSNAIVIRKPAIVATLSCGTSCVVAGGTNLGLTVVAPKEIRPRTALVYTALDGVPILSAQMIDLLEDAGTGTVRRQTTLTAPTTPGQWTIDVSDAGYYATTIVVTVQ